MSYPFRSFDGQLVDRQRSGQRVYDINVDGVAHYGLFPDWVEDLRLLAGQEVVDDLGRGAEAYLQMWERAVGVPADALRAPRPGHPPRPRQRAAAGAGDGRCCAAPASRAGGPAGPGGGAASTARLDRRGPRRVGAEHRAGAPRARRPAGQAAPGGHAPLDPPRGARRARARPDPHRRAARAGALGRRHDRALGRNVNGLH